MSQHTRIYPQVAAHIARAVSILKKEANKRPKLREDLPKALTKKHRHWNEMAPEKERGAELFKHQAFYLPLNIQTYISKRTLNCIQKTGLLNHQ